MNIVLTTRTYVVHNGALVSEGFFTFWSHLINIYILFFQQHHEKGQLLEAGQEIFSNHNAIHHLHETFTKQVEKEYL